MRFNRRAACAALPRPHLFLCGCIVPAAPTALPASSPQPTQFLFSFWVVGCPAYSTFLPTFDPEVPQWCITYKNYKSKGRHGCFGRVAPQEIISTVGEGAVAGQRGGVK